MVRQETPGNTTVSIFERLRPSSGHHAYGAEARPLRSQIKDGVRVLEYIHSQPFQPLQHFQCPTESFNLKVRTCVFAMRKTVRLEG